jgi:hypothetical protein
MELEGLVQNGEVVVDRPDLLPEGAKVKILVETPEAAASKAPRADRMLGQGQTELAAAWAEAMAQMGVRGAPISPESLRAMIAACGFKPESNEFSRDIVHMREE